MPADAQKRANCDAAKETSYLTQFATNCIFATNDRYIFCSFGSGVYGESSFFDTNQGPGLHWCFLWFQVSIDMGIILLQHFIDICVEM